MSLGLETTILELLAALEELGAGHCQMQFEHEETGALGYYIAIAKDEDAPILKAAVDGAFSEDDDDAR